MANVIIASVDNINCKLNKECHDRLIEGLLHGATYELACNYAGISYPTWRRWMIQGKHDESGPFRDLYNDVKKAEGEAAMKWLKLIDSSAAKDWQAAAWKLERRYWKSYSKHVETIGISEMADKVQEKLDQGTVRNGEVNNDEEKQNPQE